MPEKNLTVGGGGVSLEVVDITSNQGETGDMVYHDGSGSKQSGVYVYGESRWIKTNAYS